VKYGTLGIAGQARNDGAGQARNDGACQARNAGTGQARNDGAGQARNDGVFLIKKIFLDKPGDGWAPRR
jgi:hypothetical protein